MTILFPLWLREARLDTPALAGMEGGLTVIRKFAGVGVSQVLRLFLKWVLSSVYRPPATSVPDHFSFNVFCVNQSCTSEYMLDSLRIIDSLSPP